MATTGAISPEVFQLTKPLDANRYATKKTIAQGMLDIALLTANASQLKYILQVGPRHEFYSLMLGLISTSIVLQILAAVLGMIVSRMDVEKLEERMHAAIINRVAVGCIMLCMVTNILQMTLGMDPALPYDPSLRYYEPPRT